MPKYPVPAGPNWPKCLVCGEDTCHAPTNSMFGHVHRWGPTDHAFVPDFDPKQPTA